MGRANVNGDASVLGGAVRCGWVVGTRRKYVHVAYVAPTHPHHPVDSGSVRREKQRLFVRLSADAPN